MKVFKYLAFLLLIAIIGTTTFISVQPNTFEVVRTITINAPTEVIYDHVIDFKTWDDWSAWVDKNLNKKITLHNKTKGVGGTYSWKHKDGIGKMKTTETIINALIIQKMQFGDFPTSEVKWTFKPNKNGTTDVVWTISSKDLPFGFKAYTIFNGGVEKQIAPYFERSLEKLEQSVFEAMKVYSIKVNGVTNHSGSYYIYQTTSCKLSELENNLKSMQAKLFDYATKNKITMAGIPFVNYHIWDEANNAVMFSCGIPTIEQVITTEGEPIISGKFESFKAIKTTLKGNYSHLKEAWTITKNYIPKNGFEISENGPMLEKYINTIKNTPNPANLTTEIYIAIKEKDTTKLISDLVYQ